MSNNTAKYLESIGYVLYEDDGLIFPVIGSGTIGGNDYVVLNVNGAKVNYYALERLYPATEKEYMLQQLS